MAAGIDLRCDGHYSVALRRCLAIAVHRLRPIAIGAALLVAVFVALTGTSIPAHALSCPDQTGIGIGNPVDVTYFLTDTACTNTDPGSGVRMTARVQETFSTSTVTFDPPIDVSTSFTRGIGCTSSGGTTSSNVAAYNFGLSTFCPVNVRLVNGMEFVFDSQTDSTGFSTALTSVTFTAPATTTTVTSTPNPAIVFDLVTIDAEVRGGTGSPTGQVTFRDGGSTLGNVGLVPQESGEVVVQSAGGFVHSCFLTGAGGVKCVGNNANGRLGNNSTTSSTTPVDVSGLTSGVVQVVTGSAHSCALTTAYGVKCWGRNNAGQLGNNSTTSSSTPADVTGLTSGVTAISAAFDNTCALTTAGGAKCWGANTAGQLGNNSTTSSSTPVDVTGLTSGVTAIEAGEGWGCAVTTGGGAKCWGFNLFGQLGNNNHTNSSTPVDVNGLASGVRSVSGGDSSTCALMVNGGVKCWGDNGLGQLGRGNEIDSAIPVDVDGLASGVTAISVGDQYACALLMSGGLKCWGSNDRGRLGDGTTTNRSSPVDVVGIAAASAVDAGQGCTFAVTTGRAVKRFGSSVCSGSIGDVSRPTAIDGLPEGRATASFATAALTVGDHNLFAEYAGDTNRVGSISNVVAQTVNKAPTALALTASPASPGGFAQSVTFTATLTQAGGGAITGATVTFTAGGIGLLGTGVTGAGGQATVTVTLPPGVRTVTATFAATALIDTSSDSIGYTVNKGVTTTILGTSSTGQIVGTPVTLTASVGTVAPASGPFGGVVTFFRANGAVAIGTAAVSANKATLVTAALPAGANQLIARYDVAGADTRLAGSTSAAIVVNVAKRASTTALTATPNPVSVGSGVTLTATVTGSGATGNVVFRNGTATIATVALGAGKATTVFSPPAAGTLALSAAYAGNATVNASTSATINVLAAAPCSDAFSAALAIPGANGSVFGSTAGATGEAGEPNHAGNSGALNSVWCSWTAPATGTVTIDTTGSVFDTTLGVYTGGSVGALTPVAANDNIGPGSSQSRVSFAASAGTTYRIAVDGVSATGRYVLNVALAAGTAPTLAAVLPTARSVTTGTTATAFATIINAGTATATACSLALPPGFPATFRYQATNAANALVGTVDTPVNIAAGTAQSFAFAVTPLVDLNASDVALVFDCANTPTTVTVSGLNTLLLSASSTPVPDLIATSATASGDAIANIPGASGTAVFAGAALNIGATDNIVATIDDNGRNLALTALICVTDPATGACVNPASPAPVAIFTLATGSTATYAVFVTGRGNVPFDPANNRLFVRFKTADGVTRGATSVAVRTQ